MGISYGIEGNEGAGKSLLFGLTRILFEQTTNFPVLARREPGGTELGEIIRPILRDERFSGMHPITNTLLYTAARSELFFGSETPFLENNPHGILLKDRTWLSTFALQSVDGADIEYIRSVQQPFMQIPERFIVIDIPVEETIVRMMAAYKRSGGNREADWRDKQNVGVLKQIRENYLNFVRDNRERCIVLNCFDDPWEKAAIVKLDAVCTLSTREGATFGALEKSNLLHTFSDEAKLIVETHETHIYSPENRYVKTFDIEVYRNEVEEARRELNYPGREELQRKMHNEWQKLGIEGNSLRGLERR